MIKIFLIIILLCFGQYPLQAAQESPGDQEFLNALKSVKNPFDDGIPKPVIDVKPLVPKIEIKPKVVQPVKPKIKPVIKLPELHLDGVIVGENVHQAIIDDQVVPLLGIIKGAQVSSVTKKGVVLLFKGKKFFLKVE